MAEYKDIFKIRHNNLAPEKGKILISEPFLQNSFFQRSVILLIEHNENGSMGFVVNKKTDLWLNDFIVGLENIPHIPIYLGGPVSSDRLFFIHSLGDVIPDSIQVDEDLFCDGDFESLSYYLMSGKPVEGKIKFLLGYSGWTKSQLVEEINQDSWLVGQSTNHQIIDSEDELFWKQAVESIGGPYLAWINYPKDPQQN